MTLLRRTSIWFSVALGIAAITVSVAQAEDTSWLDESQLVSWNEPGLSIPAAPSAEGDVDPRCRAQARSAELEEDGHVQDQGWDLIGAYQGGWQMVVIHGTASYDGMCRPWQYQAFVFVRGVFVGTLSPETMNSRTDGALSQVFLRNGNQLTAEYMRYTDEDPLCCPSSTTSVAFKIAGDEPVLQPVSTSTSSNR